MKHICPDAGNILKAVQSCCFSLENLYPCNYEEAAFAYQQLQTGSLQQFTCSVERGLTGSKQSITRETVSAFYTNGTKTTSPMAASKEAKTGISDQQLRWLLEGLNGAAGSKMAPHPSENTENLRNAGKSDDSMV